MFCYCSLLSYLPDISKWKLKNITIDDIFKGCSSLITIPDITKWEINDYKTNKEKNNSSSIDSISLQENSDNINEIKSSISSKENSSSDKKDKQSSNHIEDYNIFDNDPFDENNKNDEHDNYYENFYK